MNVRKWLTQIRILLFMILNRSRSFKANYFDRLYTFSHDPFENEASSYEQAKLDLIFQFLFLEPYKLLMDMGCGTGAMTVQLAKKVKQTIGIDFSQEAIAIARQRYGNTPNLDFVVANLSEYKPSSKADVIVASEVLYYIRRNSKQEFEKVVRNIASLVLPGGKLIVSHMASDSAMIQDLESHFRVIDRKESKDWKRPFAVTLLELKADI